MSRSVLLDAINLIRFVNLHLKITEERKKFISDIGLDVDNTKNKDLTRKGNDTDFNIDEGYKKQIDNSMKLMDDVAEMIEEDIKVLENNTSFEGYMKSAIKNLIMAAIAVALASFTLKIALSTFEIPIYLVLVALVGMSFDNLKYAFLTLVVSKSSSIMIQQHMGNLILFEWYNVYMSCINKDKDEEENKEGTKQEK